MTVKIKHNIKSKNNCWMMLTIIYKWTNMKRRRIHGKQQNKKR